MSKTEADPLRISGIFQQRYEIVRCLKSGGMGAVYEVIHVETRRRCALKVMLPSIVADADLRARFRLEATVTAEIDSEHIVMVLDAGVDLEAGLPFIVMELLKGEELGALLARRGPLPPSEVIEIMAQLACALEKTHAAGIVHRDLKPANLFITHRDDGTLRVKVLDFGIAKVVDQGAFAEQTRAMMGTPFYMAPEQVSGWAAVGPAADLYAAGHIAYTLLTGEAYWKRDRTPEGIYPLLLKVTAGMAEPAIQRAAARGVALPPAFNAWFERAVAVAPEHRFACATELVDALAVALGAARIRRQASMMDIVAPPDGDGGLTALLPPAPAGEGISASAYPTDVSTGARAPSGSGRSITAAVREPEPAPRSLVGWVFALGAVALACLTMVAWILQPAGSSRRIQSGDDLGFNGGAVGSAPVVDAAAPLSSAAGDPTERSTTDPPHGAPSLSPLASSSRPPLNRPGASSVIAKPAAVSPVEASVSAPKVPPPPSRPQRTLE